MGAKISMDSAIAALRPPSALEKELILGGIGRGKQVRACSVGEADMDMHAGARPFGIGLGHEGGDKAMLARRRP